MGRVGEGPRSFELIVWGGFGEGGGPLNRLDGARRGFGGGGGGRLCRQENLTCPSVV